MIRTFLRQALLENTLLKAMAFVLALVVFVSVRGDKEAVTGVDVKVIYVHARDRVLMTPEVPELTVKVRGPLTRIEQLDERAIEPVRIDLAAAVGDSLRFSDEMIVLPQGLRVASITPSQIDLRFEDRIEKEVPVQPVLGGDPAPGHRVVRSTATPKTVRVSGARSVVARLTRVPTTPVRIAGARETLLQEVQLTSPPRHSTWLQGDTVTIEVEVATALAERVLEAVPVRVTGLTRLEATTEPKVADVVLRGPTDALAAVAEGAITLIVDAQAEDAHPPGVSRRPINVAGMPSGLAAEVRPQSVTLVTQRRKP